MFNKNKKIFVAVGASLLGIGLIAAPIITNSINLNSEMKDQQKENCIHNNELNLKLTNKFNGNLINLSSSTQETFTNSKLKNITNTIIPNNIKYDNERHLNAVQAAIGDAEIPGVIKKILVKEIKGTNPKLPPIQESDIDVSILPNSDNNIKGTVEANITIKNNYYVDQNGKPQPTKTLKITISGFNELTALKINEQAVQGALSSFNLSDIDNNNNQVIDKVKEAIRQSLTSDMFSNGQVPSIGDISVNITPDPANQNQFKIEVEIKNTSYVDSNGKIITGKPFSQTFNIDPTKKIGLESNTEQNYKWVLWVTLAGFGLVLILLLLLGRIERRK